MPFALAGCLAVFAPRVALAVVWFLGGGYLQRAFDTILWPVLGFFFLPTTTLAYAFAHNTVGLEGDRAPVGWVIVGVAVAMDLGLTGRAARR